MCRLPVAPMTCTSTPITATCAQHAHRALFNVNGSQGIRTAGRAVVFSTPNPFLFSGRVLIQAGEGN